MAHLEGSALAGARTLTAAHRWREVAQRANSEEQMSARCLPDLPRCPFRLTVEREWPVPPSALYAAWVKRVDLWFAASGSAVMRTEGNAPFFCETADKCQDQRAAQRHPHDGRCLPLVPNQLGQPTWVTRAAGRSGGMRPGAGHAGCEGPSWRSARMRCLKYSTSVCGPRGSCEGRPHGLHTQAVDDPERHGETPRPLAAQAGLYRLISEKPLDKRDSCSARPSRRLLGAAHRGC
jgi:hypothetical protein